MNQLSQARVLQDWVKTLPIANPPTEQLSLILLKETRAPWRLRDCIDLQRELNQASALTERIVTLHEAKAAHAVLHEAIQRLKMQSLTIGKVLSRLRREPKLNGSLGPLAFVLEQQGNVLLHQPAENGWAVKSMEEIENAIRDIPETERNDVMLEDHFPVVQKNMLANLLTKVTQVAMEGDRTTDMRCPTNKSVRCVQVQLFRES
jgi:hypothetical protein